MTTEKPQPRPAHANENRVVHNQSVNTDARPSTGGGAQPRGEPQLPHDIDESTHSQERAAASQVNVGNHAYADAVGPTQDTDKATVTDAVYNGAVAPDRGDAAPRK